MPYMFGDFHLGEAQPSKPANLPAPPAQPSGSPVGSTVNYLSGLLGGVGHVAGQAGQALVGAGNQVKAQTNSIGSQFVNRFGSPATRDFYNLFNQHNVPFDQQMALGNQLHGVQDQYNQGNYLGAYQAGMGALHNLNKANPNLAKEMGPLLQQHYGISPMLWNTMGAWHGMVGEPGNFAKLIAGLAPGLLRASSGLGALGPMALYSLISGNPQTQADLKNVFGKSGAATLAYSLLPH